MIKYGTVELKVKANSLRILPTMIKDIRHYPGTDVNDAVENGRGATTITCVLLASTEVERILYGQILHSDTESTLEIGSFFYKKVIAGDNNPYQPTTLDLDNNWQFDASFTALDPIPYSVATGGALY